MANKKYVILLAIILIITILISIYFIFIRSNKQVPPKKNMPLTKETERLAQNSENSTANLLRGVTRSNEDNGEVQQRRNESEEAERLTQNPGTITANPLRRVTRPIEDGDDDKKNMKLTKRVERMAQNPENITEDEATKIAADCLKEGIDAISSIVNERSEKNKKDEEERQKKIELEKKRGDGIENYIIEKAMKENPNNQELAKLLRR